MKEVGWDIEIYVGIVILSMYIKCGSMEDVFEVFDFVKGCNVVLWIVMIVGFV